MDGLLTSWFGAEAEDDIQSMITENESGLTCFPPYGSNKLPPLPENPTALDWLLAGVVASNKDSQALGADEKILNQTESDEEEWPLVEKNLWMPDSEAAVQEGTTSKPHQDHLATVAHQHLELLAAELLRINKIDSGWIVPLTKVATQVAKRVHPSVHQRPHTDMLDIRPYAPIKCLPFEETCPKEAVFIGGIVFHKTVAHKKMASNLDNPLVVVWWNAQPESPKLVRIDDMPKGLCDAEAAWMSLLQPNTLILVHHAVSWQFQAAVAKKNVVLVQQVKDAVLKRVVRQTGAVPVANASDFTPSKFGRHIKRFRLMTFRDSEDPSVAQLGNKAVDGAYALKAGLAPRFHSKTYCFLEGCPAALGSTLLLRGPKSLKSILSFLVHAAYNLKLETTYLRERRARLRPSYCSIVGKHTDSSSLAVSYGKVKGRRPWNGSDHIVDTSMPVSALDHPSILITSVWMTAQTQCCPAEIKGISYYSQQDVALGQFLRDSCFNLRLKCQNPSCKKTVLDHSLSFVHNDGLVMITVSEMDRKQRQRVYSVARRDDNVCTWTYCGKCRKVVTPIVLVSEDTWKFSFGKFLEVCFYNRDAIMQTCGCPMQTTTLFFGCGDLAAKFSYEAVAPYNVSVRGTLPLDVDWHRQDALKELTVISTESSRLLAKFDKHVDSVAREAQILLHSIPNKEQHLHTVLKELNRIGLQVNHAAQSLKGKITSASESTRTSISLNINILRFPWVARRYLFTLMTSWNEKLRASGQILTAMKKLSSGSSTVSGDSLQDELMEGIARLHKLNEQYARYNLTDMNQSLPNLPSTVDTDFDDEFEDVDGSMDFSDGVDADVFASRRRLKHISTTPSSKSTSYSRSSGRNPTKTLGTQRRAEEDSLPPKPSAGGAVKSAITRFFNRGGKDYAKYVVDMGIFREGRPRMPPGNNGEVIPVVDDQLSTIVAYTLVSSEYQKQFRYFSKVDTVVPEDELDGTDSSRILSQPDIESRTSTSVGQRDVEKRMISRRKSHIKVSFRDYDEKGRATCKFVCTSYWATQFCAVREVYLRMTDSTNQLDVEQSYVSSLSAAYSWAASGGKSGASFAKTSDDRFVIKNISRTELQMFLECSSAYFEYLTKAFFHGL